MDVFRFAVAFLVVALFNLVAPSPSSAECRKSWVCDNGRCGYRDICTSTLDLPSINIPPLPALPTIQLKPLPSLALPPLGTTSCRYMVVNGRWQNVCK